MCWQLKGKWQSRVGGFGLGFHFGHQDCPSPVPPPPVLWSLSLPSSSAPALFSCAFRVLCLESVGEREGGEASPTLSLFFLPLSPWLELLSPLGFSAPTCFSFCLFLPHSLSLLMWLTPPPPPRRRLARWAGASRSCK